MKASYRGTLGWLTMSRNVKQGGSGLQLKRGMWEDNRKLAIVILELACVGIVSEKSELEGHSCCYFVIAFALKAILYQLVQEVQVQLLAIQWPMEKMHLPSVVNIARFLNYLYFLLLFSTWPGLYISSWFPDLLLVHSCCTPSLDTVAFSDAKDTIF